MKRSVIFALAALAVLALPSLAGAKEISKVEFCGEKGCEAITGAAANRLARGGDDLSRPPAAPGPYYRVQFTAKGDGRNETWAIYYVPSAHRLALPDGSWQNVTGTVRAGYDRVTAHLTPYPTPMLERVLIDGLGVQDPSSYLALFDARTDKAAVPNSGNWVPVEFRFRGETPWSFHQPYVFYSPEDGLLQRGIEMVKLPDDMVASMSARESLAPPDGFPWVIAAMIALALAVLAGGGIWLAVRREWRIGTRRAPVPTT